MKNKKIMALIGVILVLVNIAASPVLQSYTPFANIRVRNDSQLNTVTVSGAANFDGALDFDGPLDMGAQIISNIGNAGTDFLSNGGLTLANALTVTTGGMTVSAGGATIAGTVALDASEIGATEIANVTRVVNIPLGAFIDCQTDAGALIGFDTTADTLPDYVNSATDGTGRVLRFDDTGATEDQNSEICSELTIPADYASGGSLVVRVLKDAHTAATEVINCAVSVNGAALQAAGTVTTSASASTSYTCTPTISALAANDSLSVEFHITSDTTMNDTVDLASVGFSYVGTQ